MQSRLGFQSQGELVRLRYYNEYVDMEFIFENGKFYTKTINYYLMLSAPNIKIRLSRRTTFLLKLISFYPLSPPPLGAPPPPRIVSTPGYGVMWDTGLSVRHSLTTKDKPGLLGAPVRLLLLLV